jgi:hypothetical protein
MYLLFERPVLDDHHAIDNTSPSPLLATPFVERTDDEASVVQCSNNQCGALKPSCCSMAAKPAVEVVAP